MGNELNGIFGQDDRGERNGLRGDRPKKSKRFLSVPPSNHPQLRAVEWFRLFPTQLYTWSQERNGSRSSGIFCGACQTNPDIGEVGGIEEGG